MAPDPSDLRGGPDPTEGDGSLVDTVLVSNRGPLSFRMVDGRPVRVASGGGLAGSLLPIVEGTGATWVASALGEADVHVERARVAMGAARHSSDGAPHLEEARRELNMALALDPTKASALVLQSRTVRPEERVALARWLTAAHPESGRGWLLLSDALEDSSSAEEREAALRKAIALTPDDPRPLNNLAWMYLNQRRVTEAGPLITRAVELAPYNSSMLDTLAAVQAALGRCSEAANTQAHAIDVLPDGIPPPVRQDFEGRLQRYRTACTPSAALAPGGG